MIVYNGKVFLLFNVNMSAPFTSQGCQEYHAVLFSLLGGFAQSEGM